ncbi:MAG: 7-cyano-7-deazaguanine synthase QueC [Pseudomonadales bacterium]|nr:7-cyano-7-deazaguanine synthase QueC [Pseudomonadales bacterium]
MSGTKNKAVVLVSGGLDSATVLALATQDFETHALSFDYGQKHRSELVAAARVAKSMGAASHQSFNIDLRQFGGSALTDDSIAVPTMPTTGIPVTYVPARNTVFLSLALGLAETLAAQDLFIGVNAVDYSGYPDCRPEFIAAFENLANLATKIGIEGDKIRVHTPLISLTKAEIIGQGQRLGVDYAQTVSCYQATDEGAACRVCDSCRIRAQGFQDAGVDDPTLYVQ